MRIRPSASSISCVPGYLFWCPCPISPTSLALFSHWVVAQGVAPAPAHRIVIFHVTIPFDLLRLYFGQQQLDRRRPLLGGWCGNSPAYQAALALPSVTRFPVSSGSPASRASSPPCVNWRSGARWRNSTQMWYMTGCDHGNCSLEMNSNERLRQSQYSAITTVRLTQSAPPLFSRATNWPNTANGRALRRRGNAHAEHRPCHGVEGSPETPAATDGGIRSGLHGCGSSPCWPGTRRAAR